MSTATVHERVVGALAAIAGDIATLNNSTEAAVVDMLERQHSQLGAAHAQLANDNEQLRAQCDAKGECFPPVAAIFHLHPPSVVCYPACHALFGLVFHRRRAAP
jgi:hypothetical protein